MFDLWAAEHSVLREKVIEHIFLAELSRTLLLDMGMPFEVLRAEFDANGYDVAIEAGGLLRHIQLKATVAAGKRANVDIQLSLADKPAGCVVWIFADPQTLQLGPFLWFGGERGEPLPPLGDRGVRHSKGDATGEKKVRPGLRRIPKGMFTRLETIHELAMVMFPPVDLQLIERHLAQDVRLAQIVDMVRGISWETSAPVAYMIDGYSLAKAAGIADPIEFANAKRTEAEREGQWTGTTLELWLALFMEHRRDHFSGPVSANIETGPLPLLDELCDAFAEALIADCG